MSCSWCIKCSQPVSMYQKYCDICLANYGVRQDETWHKYHHFADWEHDRKVEFAKDYQLALQSFRPTQPAPHALKSADLQAVSTPQPNPVPKPKRKRARRR